MDPYKLLGISTNQVKQESDLNNVRQRAKMLYKRHNSEGKKFDAKKVLEAFELVKQGLKGRVGEGQYKLLGRSRKERELDKHFNHQTKDIKKNKKLLKALKAARHGTAKTRIHLPGDKERIPRQRRGRRHHRSRRRRRDKKSKHTDVNILEGLNRLAIFLPQESKFAKVIKLLYTWIKDYMNQENREYTFKVLHGVANCGFLTNNPDTRQDITMVFEYVLGYFREWFERGLETSLFCRSWQVATVLACRCYTDDAFVLSSTITKLKAAMDTLEKHKDIIGVVPERIDRLKGKKEEKKEQDEEESKLKRAKLEDCDSTGVKSEADDDDDDDSVKSEASFGAQVERETAKGKCEVKAKDSIEDSRTPLIGKPLVGMAAPVGIAAASPALLPSPSPLASPEGDCNGTEPLASPSTADDAEDDDLDVLSSGSDLVDVASDDDVLDVGSDESDEVKGEEIDIGSSEDGQSGEEGEISSEGEVEEIEGSIFATPPPGQSLDLLRQHFVERCLASLFQQRGPLWARPKIDAFFQDIFYRRSVFTPEQQTRVEAWQSRIKTNQRLGERQVGEANNPLEAQRPVVDSREMRTVIDSDSNAWSAKQTFDSRESASQRVIR